MPETRGLRKLTTNSQMRSVGLPLPDTMGQPALLGLCHYTISRPTPNVTHLMKSNKSCKRCGLQYVSSIKTNKLYLVSIHFNSPDHSAKDIKLMVIEASYGNTNIHTISRGDGLKGIYSKKCLSRETNEGSMSQLLICNLVTPDTPLNLKSKQVLFVQTYLYSFPCRECSLTCANGGTKNDAECNCDCSPPWSGDTCSECSLTCANGGTKNDAECVCDCSSPLSGDTCSGNFITVNILYIYFPVFPLNRFQKLRFFTDKLGSVSLL